MTREFKLRAAFALRMVPAGALLALMCLPAMAQQEPKPSNPPSPDQTAPDQAAPNPPEKPKNMPMAVEDTMKLLAKRSIFFPDLATDKRALRPLQKLQLATDNSVAPSTIAGDLIGAGYDQATNSLSGYGGGWGGYGKRFGSSVATGTTDQYLRTFLLPTWLHEDPRYFVKLRGTPAKRILYAVTRVLVTESDSRKEEINWSEIAGPLMAEGLANVYLPSEERTVARTFRRYGIRVGFDGAINVVKEYWPTIFRELRLSQISATPPADPNVVTPPQPEGQPH
ncbi:MAG: hypothetical protein WAN24_03840 [Candidatus Acidiferrales bacterium]